MKRESNNVFKNYITIEVNSNEIVQVRGKMNQDPSKYDLKIIEIWAQENNLKLT